MINVSLIYQILFGSKKMISLPQIRSFFLTMTLAVMLATAITFGFASADSWAATSSVQITSQPQTQIATMNRVEAIMKNIGGKVTGDSKTKTASKEAKRFKSETLKGMDNSIANPDYQPAGRTKQAEKLNRKGTEDMEAEAREAFK